MINIAFVIDWMWGANGGTEGQLLMLKKHIDKNKFNVHLVCLRNTEWMKNNRSDFPIVVIGINKLLDIRNISKLYKFKKFCTDNNIHIVQTYFEDGFIFGVLGGRLAGIKHIIACRRDLGPGYRGAKGIQFIFSKLKHLTTGYIVNSQATKTVISKDEGIDLKKINVIYNGLDIDRFRVINNDYKDECRRKLGLTESQTVIGMISHLRKDKNIEFFIEAAKHLHEKHPETCFYILGEGSYRPIIESYLTKLKANAYIKLAGSVLDVIPYLAAMDIACLTSDGESFSNAIIEYLAAGLPVVASSVGGNVEALRENGFLFPRGDKEKFIELVSELIENKELRLKVGQNAQQEAWGKYSIANMVSAHEKLYLKLISQ